MLNGLHLCFLPKVTSGRTNDANHCNSEQQDISGLSDKSGWRFLGQSEVSLIDVTLIRKKLFSQHHQMINKVVRPISPLELGSDL